MNKQDELTEQKIQVAGVSCYADSEGYLVGTLHFNTIKFFGQELNSIDFGRTGKFLELGVGIGSVLTYQMEESNTGRTIKLCNVEKHSIIVFPSRCPVCGAGVIDRDKDAICSNLLCPQKNTTTLYKLPMLLGHRPWEFKDYFNKFPDRTGICTRVRDLFSYKILFEQAGPKQNAARIEILSKAHPRDGRKFWDLEVELEKKFDDGFSIEEFWDLCSIPGVDKRDVKHKSPTGSWDFPSANIANAAEQYKGRWNTLSNCIKIKG